MSDELSGKFQCSDATVTRQIAGEILLIPIRQTRVDFQRVYLLNDTAAAAWSLLAEPRSLDELVAALAADHNASEQQIRADVEPLVRELVAKEFLEAVTADE